MTQNTHIFSDAAGRYALSLFEVAKEEKVLDKIEENMNFLDEALKYSKDFKNFVINPTLKKIDRLKIVEALGQKIGFNKHLTNFLIILIEKNRIFFLKKVIKDFKNILSNFKGEINALVSMPTEISDSKIEDIKNMINKILKKKINLKFIYDPELISGAKIQIGSLMIDDTVKTKFKKFLNTL